MTMPTSDNITTIDFPKMAVLLDDGRSLPIVSMFDEDNETTDDTDEACVFIAGMENVWFSLYVEDFCHLVRR